MKLTNRTSAAMGILLGGQQRIIPAMNSLEVAPEHENEAKGFLATQHGKGLTDAGFLLVDSERPVLSPVDHPTPEPPVTLSVPTDEDTKSGKARSRATVKTAPSLVV